MKKIIIAISICTGSIALLFGEGLPVDTLPEHTSPNGLRLNLVSKFESWRLISSHVRIDKNEMHYIWGNDASMRGIKSAGSGEPVFEAGSIFVKMGFTMRKNPRFIDSIEPYGLQRIEFMIKDPGRFSNTGGWGYARFPYDGTRGTFSVYGKAADFARECYSCHLRVEKSDFVFTKYMNYPAGADADTVTLVLGKSSKARFPVWVLHPLMNSVALMIFLCGVFIARYWKRKKWWTQAHVALQISGIAVLAAGTSVMISVIGQGHHLNVPHAYIGMVTIASLLISACGGVVALNVPSITKIVRPIHRWAGRVSAFMMLVTISSGIIMYVAGL